MADEPLFPMAAHRSTMHIFAAFLSEMLPSSVEFALFLYAIISLSLSAHCDK